MVVRSSALGKGVIDLTLFSSILLGIIQGLTEFLPISSSGHLAIAEQLLGMNGISDIPDLFDVLLHLGTLGAIFVAYRKEIRDMIREFFLGVRDIARHETPVPVPPARRLILLIIVGTLPLFLVLPVKHLVESLSDNLYFVAVALMITGCLLYFSDHVKRGRKTERSASLLDALIVGLGQAAATCPGISRSGTTITFGCFRGFDRRFAVRYSFLMSIPAVLGANILAMKDVLEAGIFWPDVPCYLIGVAVAAVVGYGCIRILKMIAERGQFGGFAYYCWAAGAVTLIFTLIHQ